MNQVCCPYCNSEKCEVCQSYETLNSGNRKLYRCATCQRVFSETKGTFLEDLKKPISLIVKVFKARSEGMGLNAVCRVFDIAKNTLLDWELRFADLKETLMMYALMNTFLVQVIEGDELYTKVGKNVAVEDCEGWTIVLMDRASRFIWALGCGKKDRQIFFWAIQMLRDVIERTGDVTLVTDGERRYGNLLFEICHEVVRSGQRGRPPKVLRQGVKVRLKNKGAQSRQRGRKRPKYEAPHREHPQTCQDIANADIHAEHVEAFNASTRRRHSAYRRKTNTYAKKKTGLQRILDILWVVHNFIRVHFTTQQVPAVALGILDKGLSWEQALRLQKIA
ncbi:MAG: IS1 family transposase [Aestuariibacter sp.]|nr:IS1 family transposase [Aestuariibacter sp.]